MIPAPTLSPRMRLTLPYPPSTNALYATVRGNRVKTKAARLYCEVCALTARRSGMQPIVGPVRVTLDVFRPRRCGDLDNTLKSILDSLKGIAWQDDAQVEEIHARRHEDKVRPRVELAIEASARVENGGLFK